MFARSSRCLPAVRDAWPTSLASLANQTGQISSGRNLWIRKILSPGLGGHARSMWSLKVHPRPLRHKFRRVLGGAVVPAVIVVCFYAWQLQATQFEPYDGALTFEKLPETAAGHPGQPAWLTSLASLASLAKQPF